MARCQATRRKRMQPKEMELKTPPKPMQPKEMELEMPPKPTQPLHVSQPKRWSTL